MKALERTITQFVYLDEAGGISFITDPSGVNVPDAAMRRQATAAAKLLLRTKGAYDKAAQGGLWALGNGLQRTDCSLNGGSSRSD